MLVYHFFFNELNDGKIGNGELKKLEDESYSLENAESIKTALLGASNVLRYSTRRDSFVVVLERFVSR